MVVVVGTISLSTNVTRSVATPGPVTGGDGSVKKVNILATVNWVDDWFKHLTQISYFSKTDSNLYYVLLTEPIPQKAVAGLSNVSLIS